MAAEIVKKRKSSYKSEKPFLFRQIFSHLFFQHTAEEGIVYSALLNGSCPRDSGIYKIPLKIEAAGGIQVEVAPGEVCGIHSYVHRYRGRRNNSSTGNLFTFVFNF